MLDQPHTIWPLLSLDQLPLWLKVFFTLFVCLIVPVYWVQYGPGNFLWFSDIALLLTLPAVWLESALLASMSSLALVLEFAWMFDFFFRLITGVSAIGLSSYMFDAKIAPPVRALSLFHIALPILLLWMVFRLGYDSRALGAQTLLAWIVLPISYLVSDRSENINWVYGYSRQPQKWMPPLLYLALLMALFPLVIYVPTHFLLLRLFN